MSNQRGLVQRIERKLENTVGDAVARVFGGSIVPQEVEALLRREASDGVQTLQGGRLLAPNEYVITLSGSDFEKVNADRDVTSDTFARHLGGYLREQGWQTYGDVVVRFEQSQNLHTGQYRARGVVNPDASPHPTAGAPAPAQSKDAFTAEPGVPPMSDNPSYRGDQGQGRPADDYYEDRYARPLDEQRGGAPEQRGPYPPEDRGGYAPPNDPNYPPRGGYPEQGGYQQGYPSQGGYEQRPPAGYGGGYDQGYRQPPPGYGPPPQAPYGPPAGGGYGAPSNDYDYGRAPGRHEEPGYGRPEPRPAYPDQGGYEQQQGYPGQGGYGRQDYAQPDYPRYEQGGYGEQGRDYDYGQPAGGGYAGYGQAPAGEYRVPATTSHCSSTTAADAPTSCAKVPTSSAAARTRSSGCPTPGCRGGIWRSAGTARSRCSPTSTRPTARRSTTRPSKSGSWPTVTSSGSATPRSSSAFTEAGGGPRLGRSCVASPSGPAASKYRDGAAIAARGRRGRRMQGLVLQLTRAGFLLLLWLFIWSVLRILRNDIYAPTGAVMVRRGLALRGALLPSRQQRSSARYLVVTDGALAGTRITLGSQPVLIGRADDSTLVLTDDYASTRHARLSQRGPDWYVEDLGSTNGTYLDRAKVTTAVRVPIGTPVHIGKTVIELRP